MELEDLQVLRVELLELEELRPGSGVAAGFAGSTAGWGEGSLFALFPPGGSEAGCWLLPPLAAS